MEEQHQDQPTDEEIERLVAEQQEAMKARHIAAHGQESWDAYQRHLREEEALCENCRVLAFHNDPITREAGLDARELRSLAPKCDGKGCRRDRDSAP
jgi:hypothetical protein